MMKNLVFNQIETHYSQLKELPFVCEKMGQYRYLKVWSLEAELQQHAQG